MNTATGRVFAYLRVSTVEQDTELQIDGIRKQGYDIREDRIVAEKVSGTIPAMQRKGFKNLIDNKLEKGDTLIVLKIDRLGRDNADIQNTIKLLQKKGINLKSLDLPFDNLTDSGNKLMLDIFSAFAEFERNRIIERTKAGQQKAREKGKKIGRPVAVDTTKAVQGLKIEGKSQTKVAKELGISIATVKRHWNKES